MLPCEAARIQGYIYHVPVWPPTASDVFHLVGNSMCICQVQRLIVAVLAGIGKTVGDPWFIGTAQRAFRDDVSKGEVNRSPRHKGPETHRKIVAILRGQLVEPEATYPRTAQRKKRASFNAAPKRQGVIVVSHFGMHIQAADSSNPFPDLQGTAEQWANKRETFVPTPVGVAQQLAARGVIVIFLVDSPEVMQQAG